MHHERRSLYGSSMEKSKKKSIRYIPDEITSWEESLRCMNS